MRFVLNPRLVNCLIAESYPNKLDNAVYVNTTDLVTVLMLKPVTKRPALQQLPAGNYISLFINQEPQLPAKGINSTPASAGINYGGVYSITAHCTIM